MIEYSWQVSLLLRITVDFFKFQKAVFLFLSFTNSHVICWKFSILWCFQYNYASVISVPLEIWRTCLQAYRQLEKYNKGINRGISLFKGDIESSEVVSGIIFVFSLFILEVIE